MKCQHCEKPATFHITELTGAEPQEVHLCEDHAQEFLAPQSNDSSPDASEEAAQEATPPLPFGGKKPHKVSQTAEELARLDQRTCPKCGITFHEFRQQGRLGCPFDYEFFQRELEPLLVNIHGERQHVGKRPRSSSSATQLQAELLRLRREMRDAVQKEDYERASQLRDEIRRLDKDGTNS